MISHDSIIYWKFFYAIEALQRQELELLRKFAYMLYKRAEFLSL